MAITPYSLKYKYVLNSGIEKIFELLNSSSNLEINKFEIGSTANYEPSLDQTAVLDLVFDDEDPLASGNYILNTTKISNTQIQIDLLLNNLIGDFNIGEFILKFSDGTPFVIGILDTTFPKLKDPGGNAFQISLSVNGVNSSTVEVTQSLSIYNYTNSVNTEADLPDPSSSTTPNIYVVKNYNNQGSIAIAYKDENNSTWRLITQLQGEYEEDEVLIASSNQNYKSSSRKISDNSDYSSELDNIPTKNSVKNYFDNSYSSFKTKNAIINGSFDIWQRGSSFSSISGDFYSVDRWVYYKSGSMVHSISRSTDVPSISLSGRLFNYSALLSCTTSDSSISSTDFCIFQQRVEGYNFLPLARKNITISFYIKSSKTGVYNVALGNETPFDRSCVKEFTIDASNTWERKIITFPASPSDGTWNFTNGIGLRVSFCLASGSTYQTSTGTWNNGNFYGSSNQVNACDSTSNNIWITGVQLEEGEISTQFEYSSFQENLLKCQRYYEKSYNLETAPGTITTNGQFQWWNQTGQSSRASINFKAQKRSSPSFRVYSPQTGTIDRIYADNGGDLAATAGSYEYSAFVLLASGGNNTNLYCNWVANSEL